MAVAVLVSGCASDSPARRDLDPEVFGVIRQDGKGTPNGRSDSGQPFVSLGSATTDASYGYTAKNPIKLGGVGEGEGPQRERLFLSSLRGPGGEPIAYERLGSCCPIESENGFDGWAMLDKFELRIDGHAEPRYLYISIYDEDAVGVPFGLSSRREDDR
ncbi:Hypothetical protein I596_2913 [Dokdonella koreensis DS-123]|uniref:2-dehydro-3-deoxyphosphooctonate aldolase n=2 Tax=Dokdonella TaxID=323413 RepID=A0A167H4Q4_9GAMM|nr:Hypothetical protein I596_2913 [Dokdonella koreensis DS-123]